MIYWRAPALMVAALLVGIAFSIGHHEFYKSLDRSEVRSASYDFAGWSITPQQLNIAGGTALAFAVKASLVVAISTAYVQLFFQAIAKFSHGMASIDSWFSGLNDFTSLFGLTTFWTRPLLAAVALTAWLLPIAAIITPATLSVTFDYLPPVNESHFVPLPAFESFKIANAAEVGYLVYGSASAEASRVVQAAAAAGSILPITPPVVNASWVVTTPAPRYACDQVDETLLAAIKENVAIVWEPLLTSFDPSAGEDGSGVFSEFVKYMFGYMSWPGSTTEYGIDLPFFRWKYTPENVTRLSAADNATAALDDGLNWFRGENPDLLFVASLPRFMPERFDSDYGYLDHVNGNPLSLSEVHWLNISGPTRTRKAMDWAFEGASVLRCELVASEYTLRFSYDGPSQMQIEILHVTDTGMFLDSSRTHPASAGASNHSGCFHYSTNYTNECAIDSLLLLQFSYRAMADLFTDLLVGGANFVGNQYAGVGATALFPSRDLSLNNTEREYQYTSKVLSTSLADTIELQPLNKPNMGPLQLIGGERNATRALSEAYSLSRPESAVRKHLKDAIEELFFNVTMSLASSPVFLYNMSAPNAPENVTVAIRNMGNIYSYSADKLWLAYGLAIGITVLNVAIGLLTMLKSGASYTPKFSTIARVAKNADVSVATEEQRCPGKDPLPKPWKRATFKVRSGALHELKTFESRQYSSVNQRGEDHEIPLEYDEPNHQGQADGILHSGRHSQDSGKADNVRIAVQDQREEQEPRISDELRRLSPSQNGT